MAGLRYCWFTANDGHGGSVLFGCDVYDSDKAREHWRERGIGVCISPKRNRLVQHWYDTGLYRTQHVVENSLNRLKDFRRLSLRLDKTDTSFRGVLAFAAAIRNWRLKVRLCAQTQAHQ